jgi:dienelactone hydrolase
MVDQNTFAMICPAASPSPARSAFDFRRESARGAWRALALVLASLALLWPVGAFADGEQSGASLFHSVDEIWRGYDPRALPLDAEVLHEGAAANLVVRKIRYTSEIADGVKVRIIGYYGFPGGGGRHPAILHIHGGSQVASRGYVEYWVKRGYATLSINWGGLPQGDALPGETDWGPLKVGLADVHSDRRMAPDARANSWFHWAVACRRALTFLEQQGEVDAARIGVFGISRGGRLTWLLAGLDDRIATAVSIYGAAGVQDAYTVSKPEEAPFSPADLAIWRACLDAPAYAPRIRIPFLFLSAANDFYGVIDRAETALDTIPHGQVWRSYSPHSTHHLDPAQSADLPLWMDRWLNGGPAWPATPTADVQLATPDHTPIATILPDRAQQVRGVTVYYSTEPNPKARFWRTVAEPAHDASASQWRAPLPLSTAGAGLWLYANVDYADGPVLSTRLTAIPAEALQTAGVRAREKPTALIDDFSAGARDWFYFGGSTDPVLTDKPWFEIVAGPEGGKAIRGSVETPSRWRFATRKIVDPQWRAPEGAALRLRLRAERPGKIVALACTDAGQANERVYAASATLHGGDWETVTLPAAAFHHVRDGRALPSFAPVQILSVQSEHVVRGKTRADDITIGEPWKGVPPALARFEWVAE